MSPTSFNDLLNMDTQQLLDNFLKAEPSVTAVDVRRAVRHRLSWSFITVRGFTLFHKH